MKAVNRVMGVTMFSVMLFSAVHFTTACQNAQQAVNGVFTAEQVICMVLGLVSGSLTGEVGTIAQDLQANCGMAPALTQDIINFINSFNNLAPEMQAKWKKAAENDHPALKLMWANYRQTGQL